MSGYSEESFYALSDIADSLSILRMPKTCWTTIIDGDFVDLPNWRVRYDGETNLLIEEINHSKTYGSLWRVQKTHMGIENHSKAVMFAAKLANDRKEYLEPIKAPVETEQPESSSSYDIPY